MIHIETITTNEGLEHTAALAGEIWREHFVTVISEGQIEYMLEKFQSYPAMLHQVEHEGYQYHGIFEGDEQIGYFAVCPKPDGTLFLSKLYLRKDKRGNGYASRAFERIKEIGRGLGCSSVWLTVNKGNESTIAVYRHWGMEVIRDEVTDIGGGYVMDDHVFSLPL